jgi:HD-like signal output (HDOD) protein
MALSALNGLELETVIRSLPAAPRILAQLAQRLQSADVDIDEVTRMLRRDAGLTARLIDMANSAAFMGFEPATTIEDAVARIGFRETHRIIGAVASNQLADEPLSYYALSPRRVRENSLFCALAMEDLADAADLDAGTAYTLGLLRSIGKVVLDRVARSRVGLTRFDPHHGALKSWEQATFGITNTEVAARVLELWEFPEEAVDAVRFHAMPATSSEPALLLNICCGAADAHDLGLPGERGLWRYDGNAFAQLGLDESRVQWAADRANGILQRVSPAFA